MFQAGLVAGYVDRWCLDPFEKECPETAPNYKTDQVCKLRATVAAHCMRDRIVTSTLLF